MKRYAVSRQKFLGDFLQKGAERDRDARSGTNKGVAKSALKVFGEAFYKKLRRKGATAVAKKKTATNVAGMICYFCCQK